jgi:hypothetical protein
MRFSLLFFFLSYSYFANIYVLLCMYSIVCIKKMQQKVVISKEKNHYQLVTALALFWLTIRNADLIFANVLFIFSKNSGFRKCNMILSLFLALYVIQSFIYQVL